MDIEALLLRHFEWNKEKLIEKYMDNPTTVNTASGIQGVGVWAKIKEHTLHSASGITSHTHWTQSTTTHHAIVS